MSNDLFPPTQNALALIAAGYGHSSKLTDSQRTKIANLIESRFGLVACDFCGSKTWAMGKNLVSPLPLSMDQVRKTYTVDHTTVHASVQLVCTVCGNTKLLHLSHLGFDPFAPENQ